MGRIPDLGARRRSMRHRLGWHMAVLAAVLIAAVCIGLFSSGRLIGPKAELARTLQTQADFFHDDMRSLWRNVGTSAVHLSEDMTDILENCLAKSGTSIDTLTGDLETLTAIENAMLDPLCQYIRQTRCSGAFVILDAAMRTDSEVDVRSGLYVQKNNAERTGNELLLFRGMSGVGKAHSVMPHRKWQQEFRTTQFPNYDLCISADGASTWDTCRITDLITLPGTTEDALLLTIPMTAKDGTVYGICGFEVNQTYFCSHFEQPSELSRLACIMTADTGNTLDASAGLVTYTRDGSCNLPDGTLAIRDMGGGLLRFSGDGYDFVGKLEHLSSTAGDDGHTLAVLIPKEDYDRAVFSGRVQTALLALLLIAFAVACCVLFAHRFLKPVHADMKRLQTNATDKAQMTFDDFKPLSETITTLGDEKEALQSRYAETQSQLEAIQADAKQLAARRRDEIDPAEYELFLAEYRKFSDKQRRIIDDMVDGLSPQESADHLKYQKSTVYSYRRDIYEKLNITGKDKLQQLRLRIALLRQEQEQ